MSETLEEFLQPTSYIDSDHGQIGDVVEDLRRETDSPRDLAVKLFYFVRDKIEYDVFTPMRREQDNVASAILSRRRGFCVQKAVVLAALCRNAGIPCKLCFADIRNHIVPGDLLDYMGTNLFTYHGYNAFHLGRGWVKATPAFDRDLCDRHGIIPVDFDGTSDAVFHPTNRDGQKHIEYVRDIGCYADLPFDDIIDAFTRVYGKSNPGLLELWKES